MNLILKRIGKKSGIIILGFILFMGALCTPFVALNEWLEHPISTTVDIIFGDNSSYSLKENVNVKVLKYKSEVEKWCAKDMNGYYDVSNYVNVILSIMMVESGGEGNDPMQSSECSKNTKYSKKPNSIKDTKYSIECGVKDFADALSQSVTSGLVNNDALFTTVDAYNKGLGIIKRHSQNKKYSFEESCRYCYEHRFNNNKKGYSTASKLRLMFNLQPNQYWDCGNWRWNYGNMFYVYQVLSYLNIYSFNNDGSAGANIINIASSKIGCRYWWGKSGPDYFDCSGLVYWTLNQAGITVPRLTADGFANYGRSISVNELKVGDLIAFDWNGDKKADHVSIYAGDNYMIHANGNASVKGNSSKYTVKRQNMTNYYKSHVLSCRRVF